MRMVSDAPGVRGYPTHRAYVALWRRMASDFFLGQCTN